MTNNGPFTKYIIDAVISVKPEIKKDPLTRKSLTEILLDTGIIHKTFGFSQTELRSQYH